MSTSFGISKEMPFTENMPSLVISNSHQKSWKKWKNQAESKLERNILYSGKKKNQSIHFRLYTAFNCPISLGSFSQKCFFNLWLSWSWHFWRLSSLFCGISFNLDMFVFDRNITNVMLCSSDSFDLSYYLWCSV